MKKTSKYYGKSFGKWTCTHVGIAATSKKYNSNYYYIFERRTSDNKADKMVRLNSTEAAKVFRGETTVEEIVVKRIEKKENLFPRKISYHFD